MDCMLMAARLIYRPIRDIAATATLPALLPMVWDPAHQASARYRVLPITEIAMR